MGKKSKFIWSNYWLDIEYSQEMVYTLVNIIFNIYVRPITFLENNSNKNNRNRNIFFIYNLTITTNNTAI